MTNDINKAPKAPKKYKPLGSPKKGYTITESDVTYLGLYKGGLPTGEVFSISSKENDLRIINNNDWIED